MNTPVYKYSHRLLKGLFVLTLIISMGCQSTGSSKPNPVTQKMDMPMLPQVFAKHTTESIIIDGQLTEKIWSTANIYRLDLNLDQIGKNETPKEMGAVQFAWDDNYLYVAFTFYDSDVVAEGESDQLHHYNLGDVAELFLKPADQTWYWELYATPASRKTSFWFPGRGRLGLESSYKYHCGLKVASNITGSLNNWEDKDTRWTAEMAMPIADLTSRGETFGPDSDWRVLVGRYNYSRNLSWPELTMMPALKSTYFHSLEQYAQLKLIPTSHN